MAKPPIQYFRKEDFPEIADKTWAIELFAKLNSLARQTQYGLSEQLSVKDNLLAFWWEGNVGFYSRTQSEYSCSARDSSYIYPTLLAGSPSSNKARYTRDSNGMVYLEGKINNPPIATTLFTLLPGYRPEDDEYRVVGAQGNAGVAATINIAPTGDVQLIEPASVDLFISTSFLAMPATLLESPKATKSSSVQGFPISFTNQLRDTAINAIICVSGRDVTDSSTVSFPAALGPVAWSVQGNQIVISSIGGMAPGKCYSVRLLVLGA
jgi:hypothetical protein